MVSAAVWRRFTGRLEPAPGAIREQRRHPRKDSGAELVVMGWEQDLLDLSLNGLSLRAQQAVPADRPLPFALSLPGGRRIEGLAQVRWSQSLGWRASYGLEIVRISWSDRSRLAKHLDPYHFGALELLDLLLEFSCALVFLVAIREFLSRDPSLAQTALESAPWILLIIAGLFTAHLLVRRWF
ncbi:MAG: PilZ domain-containing protein [Elusimicrobia bacterium]|nr:PilZ domain-containing protein [Elusimicrobiota bacterium]